MYWISGLRRRQQVGLGYGLWHPAQRSQGLRRFLSAAGDVRLRFSDETPKAASFDETRKGATSVAKRAD